MLSHYHIVCILATDFKREYYLDKEKLAQAKAQIGS